MHNSHLTIPLNNVIAYFNSSRTAFAVIKPCDSFFGMGKSIAVVSFEEQTEFTAYDAYTLAFQIAAYYADRYQIVFGVHEDSDNLHIHFVFNSVSFVNGVKYSGGLDDMFRLKNFIVKLIKDYAI